LLKGVDVLIKAVGLLWRQGRRVTLTIVGDGPDRKAFEAGAKALGPQVAEAIRFVGVLPAREGFAFGKLLIVPSRAESLPYIVLEAAAARVPQIASRVGGIPEIFGPMSGDLVAPGDPAALAQAIAAALQNPTARTEMAQTLQARIRQHFSVAAMTDGVLAGYKDARKQRAA
jgi:glycosyltransferase involved in cell wall biosynthesis